MHARSSVARALALVGAAACACNAIIDLDGLTFDRKPDASVGGGGGGTTPAVAWGRRAIGLDTGPTPYGLAVNPSGNIAVSGIFRGTVDLGKGSLSEIQGMNDGFVLELDPSGNAIWQKQIYGGNSQDVTGIAATTDNHWRVTGYFRQEIRIDSESASTTGQESALFELDENLAPVPPIIKYTGGSSVSQLVAVGNSAVFLKGVYKTAFTFGADPLPAPTDFYNAGFLAKVATDGTPIKALGFVGVTQGGDPVALPIGGLALDTSGNVIIAGAFSSKTLSFSNGQSIDNYQTNPDASTVDADIYLAKFDASLETVWPPKPFGAKFGQSAQDVATDSQDNIIIVGSIHEGEPFNFAPCDPVPGIGSILVVKFDKDGSCLWSKVFGHSQNVRSESANAVAVTPTDEIWVVGNFETSQVTFGDYVLDNANSTSDAEAATADVFVAKLGQDGHVIWAGSFGDDKNQYLRQVASDPSGRAIIAGSFAGTITFGSDKLEAYDSPGNFDMFIAAIGP